jgi:serine/threonine protein phosphatase PrpC
LASETAAGQIIGSTAVVLLAAENRGAVLWAGDSRLYRYRGGAIEQITRDHSLAADAMAAGLLEQGENAHCNVITRAVGAEDTLEVEHLYMDLVDGDRYLLCSDGLDKELSPDVIGVILGQGDCESSACALIKTALEHGARDNVTVVVMEFKKCE